MKNQIASVQELRVNDKNYFVTRHLKIFMELCIRKELDTQCSVHLALCDKPSKDFYGTLRIRINIFAKELLLSLHVRDKCKQRMKDATCCFQLLEYS